MEKILSAKNVSITYSIENLPHRIIDNVSFDVFETEFLSIIGPSGCGKSSLIRVMAGLQLPSSGEVIYNKKKMIEPQAGISLVFQNFALLPWKNVLDNVMLGLSSENLSQEKMEAKAAEALKSVNLEGFESAYPAELSGGMKQRVGIARAFVSNPDVLLMDEPFSSLDDLTAEQLRQELYQILKSRKSPVRSVVMVSHNVSEVVELSDKIIVLSKPPARIVDTLRVRIKHPRDKNSKEFGDMVNSAYKDLYEAEA